MKKLLPALPLRFIALALFALATTTPAQALTYSPGGITTDTTWTKAEGPYLVDTLYIPAGVTLTIEPGTIIKLNQPNCNCYENIWIFGRIVTGALNATDRVVFTSVNDDIGGDTNGDGTTTVPVSGDWRQIVIGGGGTLELYNTDVRYGGVGNVPYVYLNPDNIRQISNEGGTVIMDGADLGYGYGTNYRQWYGISTTTIRNSHIHDSGTGLTFSSGNATIENNTFSSVGSAIEYPWSMPLVHHNNHGSGVITHSGLIEADAVLTPDTLPYSEGWLTVPEGVTLTVMPGSVIKGLSSLYVSGTLTMGTATATEPVIVTSFADDTVLGDTNGDGMATTPQEGDWGTIVITRGGHADLSHTTLRYGGAYTCDYWGKVCPIPMLQNAYGTLNLATSTLTDGKVELLFSRGTTTIMASEIARGTYGVRVEEGMTTIHDSSLHDNTTYGVGNNPANPTTVDATHNYWGDPSGPTHPSNPNGVGDRVSDGVEFTPLLGAWPTTPVCTVDCFSSVLFLPGLQASRLYRQYVNCLNDCERMLWTPDGGPYFDDLYLTASGTSIWSDIYTRDVVDEAAGFNIYKSFLADLEHWKHEEKLFTDYAAIPYDWRLSLDALLDGGYKNSDGTLSYNKATSTPYIIQELERLAATSTTGKVTIVAHSNGGLVAKALMVRLEALGKANLVENIVLVASPQTGTPQALGAIMHGYNQALPIEWFPAMLSKAAARTMARNMPGAYHLLPSEQYFRDVQTPVASFVNSSPLLLDAYAQYGSLLNSWGEMNSFVLGNETQNGRSAPEADDLNTPAIGNAFLLQYAKTVHQTLDAWTPPSGVHVFQIAGWGVDTLATIKYTQKKKGNEYKWKEDFTMTEDGDGTVVVPSAHAMGVSNVNISRYWVNLKNYNLFNIPEREHADILEVPEVREFIQNIVIARPEQIPSAYVSTTRLIPKDSDKRLRYFLHSPLSLELYDDEGHHVGYSITTGMLEEQIPGAYYGEFGEVKYISAPASTTLHLVMNGYATDVFTLDIQEVEGDAVIATTTFVDIPSSTSTMVTMDFADGTIANASPLRVDNDGDGIIDHNLAPQVGVEVIIQKPKLIVTAESATSILGSPLPLFTATISGFHIGDTASTSVSGIPTCTTTATSGSPVGTYPITCTLGTLASEKYDFTTVITGTLTIIYEWSGFMQPINDTAYHSEQNPSVFRGGSTVPVKFQLKDVNRIITQASSLPAWLSPQRLSPMSASIDEPIYSILAMSGTTYRYDTVAQQYIYNWSTKGLTAGYWYRIFTKLDDGMVQSVVVGVR
jgi:pimeloyl-ACP methyl ester carboxylesterase